MRAIKFRGKRIDEPHQWEYGYIQVDGKDVWMHTIDGRVMLAIPETVGQFTGLTDRNGKEIYEGDVLSRKILGSDKRMTFVVIFKAHMGAFVAKFRDEIQPCSKVLCRYYEVVGNIHDNPELLKGGMK